MLEAMQSLRDEMKSMQKASESEIVKTTVSIAKAGPSKQPDPATRTSDPTTWTSDPTTRASHSDAQPMDTDLYGPSLPPRFPQSVQSDHGSKHSDLQSDHSDQPKRVC